MVERKQNYVCDLTLIMRMRLVCGLYNRRIVSPRWRPLAKAYCLSTAVIYTFYSIRILLGIYFPYPLYYMFHLTGLFQYLLANITSLLTGDEYIYNFFTLNKLTDVTLDSSIIYNRLHKQMKRTFSFALAYFAAYAGLCLSIFLYIAPFINVMIITVPFIVLELLIVSSYSTKLLVMALFNSRLLVLKWRLQRYGFRTVGHRQPQPYCQIYDGIKQGLKATNNPIKLLLFFDLIFASGRSMGMILLCLFDDKWKIFSVGLMLLYLVITLVQKLVYAFGHVALLESAAAHCEDMAVFTATQLIKTPTADERRRMYDFLEVLQGDAGYSLLRALPVDARLVLRVLGFCTAQVLTFAQTLIDQPLRS